MALVVKDAKDLQAVAGKLTTRILSDKKFATEVRKDPVATLKSLGLQPDVIRELLAQDNPRVLLGTSGVRELEGCNVTCIATCNGCCVTCWFTDWSLSKQPHPTFGGPVKGIPVLPEHELLAHALVERGHLVSAIAVKEGGAQG